MAAGSPLRIGVLGTAAIAKAFCEGVAGSTLVTVAAVASRDVGRASIFAQKCDIPRIAASYDALLGDPELDAIYNPLPNLMHVEWSIRAAEARKHVLCEKPIAPGALLARRVFKAARDNGVHIVEAFPYRAQAQTQKMRELIDAGEIGTVRYIQATCTFTLNESQNIRLQPALAGGALMDVGCYPVSLVRMIMRRSPSRVTAAAQWDPSGVDRALFGTLEFTDGATAQIACGFDSAKTRQALVIGSAGAIQTTYFNHPSSGQAGELLIHGKSHGEGDFESLSVPAMNGFRAEAESFARLIKEGAGEWTGSSVDESIDTSSILESLLASARGGRTVTLSGSDAS
jgi:predicted dehydrogenase